MGKRGPRPIPTKILKARGSWRARLNPAEPIAASDVPELPEGLSEEAKEIWFRILPKLLRMQIMGDVDGDALARYCDALVKWRQAARFLDEHPGLAYPLRGPATPANPNGRLIGLVPYPQNGLYKRYSRILDRLEQSFGLTPSARTRISVSTGNKQAQDSERLLKLLPHRAG